MPDPYETLVRWYLRFNGYLGVESFVIHEPSPTGIPQGAEFDILAVRFPFSREQVTFQIENDPKLLDAEAVEKSLIDFVLAEVKSGANLSLNRIWRSPDPEYIERIQYMIRWLGPFSNQATVESVASALQQRHRAVRNGNLMRLVYFARRRTTQAVPDYVPQITFEDIAKFIVGVRGPCWKEHGLGVRSAHPQWDPMIRQIWDIGAPDSPGTPTEKIERILAYVDAQQPQSTHAQ